MNEITIDGITVQLRPICLERITSSLGAVYYMNYYVPVRFKTPVGNELTPAYYDFSMYLPQYLSAESNIRYRKLDYVSILTSVPNTFLNPVLYHEFVEFETDNHFLAREAAFAYALKHLNRKDYDRFSKWTENWEARAMANNARSYKNLNNRLKSVNS